MTTATVMRTEDRWIYTGFLALIAWVPLPFGSNRIWAWSFMEVWVYLLAIVWLAGYLRGQMQFSPAWLRARPVIILLLCWLGWVSLQIVPLPAGWVEVVSPHAAELHAAAPTPSTWITLSVDPYSTKSALLKSLAYVLIFCLALLLLNTRQRLKQLAYVLILSGLLQAVYGSFMTLSGIEYGFFTEKMTGRGYASGTFTNRNHLAGYLVMCLAVGIGLMIASLDEHKNYYNWRQRLRYLLNLAFSAKLRLRLFLVIMVIALVLTHSRMGNAAFFSSLMIAGFIGLLLSRHAKRGTVILLVSLVVIDIFIIGTWFGFERVVERLGETRFAQEDRASVFGYVLGQCADYRLTGSGLGSFYSVFPHYRGHDITGYYNHAHNDYLEFLCETGIPGIMLLGSVVIGSLVMALIAQYRRRDPLMRGMSFAAIMGITAILIHSAVDFNLQIPSNAITFTLLLALGWLSATIKHKV